LRVVEIGLAYGTSALVIINEIIKYKYKTKYVVIDANQTAQWDSIGIRNIKQFLKHMDSKLKIKLIEKYSTVAMPRLKKKYDISFIDGSHDELIVIEDIRDSDRILVKNGLMIIDDVLHVGVKDAILRFFTKNKNYSRISILENSNKFIREYTLYSIDLKKQSFSNPKTMYCFQKLI
jgi:predicted O-methyltransferase YrrM